MGKHLGVVVAVAVWLGGSLSASAQRSKEKAPFSMSAKALQAAAKIEKADLQADAVIVLDEVHFTVRNAVVSEHTIHRIVKIQTEKGVRNWGYFGRGWAPWRQDRPTLKARVVDASGKQHPFDPKSIELVPQPQGEDHTYSDWRQLRAPLPGVHPGSIVETFSSVKSKRGLAKSGDLEELWIGNWVPTLASRVVIDSDKKLNAKAFLAKNMSKKVTRRKGRFHYVFTQGRSLPFEYEKNQPNDRARVPVFRFSTGKSWQALAKEYVSLVEKQIQAGPLPPEALVSKGSTRNASIVKALKLLHDHVRYTGLEFGNNAIVPWTPAETWKREFGDCKDKATSLVAMLRPLGIRAHVALLRSGGGADVHPDFPGMGGFNHAIVYVPPSGKETKGLWIDATEELAVLGQVNMGVQGRYALVASNDTTSLLQIPVATAQNNRLVEDRRVLLVGFGKGSVSEVSHFYGARELSSRYDYRERSDASLRKDMEAYIADHYQSSKLLKTFTSDAKDLNTPLTLTVEADEIGVSFAGSHTAGIDISRYGLFEYISSEITVFSNEKKHLRSRVPKRTQPLRTFPSHKEWRYHIKHAPGFEVKTLPKDQDRRLGALRFQQKFQVHKGYLEATFSVTQNKTEMSAAEVNATRLAVAKLLDNATVGIVLHHDGMALWDQGKSVEAIAEMQRVAGLEQSKENKAAEDVRLVQVLMNLGLNGEARAIIEKTAKDNPKTSVVSELLAYTRARNAFGVYLGKGFDMELALAAWRDAIEASGNEARLRGSYGEVLMKDANGNDLFTKAKLASVELKAAIDDGDDDYTWSYIRAMVHAGNYEELLEVTSGDKSDPNYEIGRLVAIAKLSGKEAMLKEAGARGSSPNRLRWAVNLLVDIGEYPLAKALLKECAPTFQKSQWGEIVKGLKAGNEGKKTLAQFLAKRIRDQALHLPFAPKDLAAQANKEGFGMLAGIADYVQKKMPSFLRSNSRLLLDVISSGLVISSTDTEGRWQRVQFSIDTTKRWWKVYLKVQGRKRQLLGGMYNQSPIARAMRDSLKRGKRAEAIALSKWAIELWPWENAKWELFSEPRVGRRVFQAAKSASEEDRARWHAAAILIHERREDLETQKALLDCAKQGNLHCKEALAKYWSVQGQYDKSLAALASLEKEAAGQYPLFALLVYKIQAQTLSGDYAAALAIISDVHTEELTGVERGQLANLRCDALSGQGKFEEAVAVMQEASNAKALVDTNNMAWQLAFVKGHPQTKSVLAEARTEAFSSGSLHTVATLLAANNENEEAIEFIVSAQKKRGQVNAIDWVVYGKVAANLGLDEVAHAAFQRVYLDETAKQDPNATSTAKLAMRWDKELASR